jgi:hypothetical protein
LLRDGNRPAGGRAGRAGAAAEHHAGHDGE